ncbi:MAG TPA: N-acetylmuramoyl-L-alanine amidase [Terriglobales bacterium]|nr:N-acetylmuramoyl-L-alanine amidase [Terriglobales bacterium]
MRVLPHLRCIAAPLALFATFALAQAAPSDADAALSRAHEMHLQLLAQPVSARAAAEYQRIVDTLAPIWADAHAPDADAARYEAAGIYVAWARDLGDAAAYSKAAKTFQDLLRLSPYTAYRRNAEFALAQIQIFHLHQPKAAAVWLRDFDQRYPADPRAAVAHQEARGERVPEPEYLITGEPLPPVPAPAPPPAAPIAAAPPPAAPLSAPPPSPDQTLKVGIGNVTSVSVFTSDRTTSVVVRLRREASFTRGAVPERHWTYFDISARGAASSRSNAALKLAVGDGRVAAIRVARNRSGTTRVVIEGVSSAIHADRGRFFPNPDRLVIAVTGAATSKRGAPATPAAPLADGSASLTRELGLKLGTVVLDAGHGGHDTGTIGRGGLYEKNLALDVTLRLGRLLRQRLGLKVVYTRADDTFIPLDERTAIANRAHADLFLSIHLNSNPDSSMRGVETYYLDLNNSSQARAEAARENAGSDAGIHDLAPMLRTIALHDKMQESRELAGDLQRSLVASAAEPDHGVQSAAFVVLIGAQMPSVLAEVAFLSNRTDTADLRQPAFRQKIAEGLCRGVARYMASLAGATATARGQ